VSEREALAELVIACSLSVSMPTYIRYVKKDLPSSEVGMSRTPCLFGAKDFRVLSKASSSSLRACITSGPTGFSLSAGGAAYGSQRSVHLCVRRDAQLIRHTFFPISRLLRLLRRLEQPRFIPVIVAILVAAPHPELKLHVPGAGLGSSIEQVILVVLERNLESRSVTSRARSSVCIGTARAGARKERDWGHRGGARRGVDGNQRGTTEGSNVSVWEVLG
jgi:hypothetical protein